MEPTNPYSKHIFNTSKFFFMKEEEQIRICKKLGIEYPIHLKECGFNTIDIGLRIIAVVQETRSVRKLSCLVR